MKLTLRKQLIAMLLVLVMMIPCVVTASVVTPEDLNKAKDQQSNIQKEQSDTQKMLDDLAKDSTDILSYIKTLDQKIAETDRLISGLDNQIKEKKVQIEDNEKLLEQAKIDSASQYESMKLRIQYMYEHNNESYLQVLFASSDMGDMLNKAEYINKITKYDREMLTKFGETLKLIEATEIALENEKVELDSAMASVEAERSMLATVQNAKQAELDNLKVATAKTKAYKAQLDLAEKEQASAILAMEVEVLRQEEEARRAAAAGGSNTLPAYDGGKFLWPVPGSVRITSYFGETEGRTSVHRGLDIGASRPGVWGDSIVAAYDGVVTISGYDATGGNWIWINHGGGLFTAYMHNSANLVSVGTAVKKGQLIARMGSTGSSTGAHLHFTVRDDGKYMDPSKYVSPPR